MDSELTSSVIVLPAEAAPAFTSVSRPFGIVGGLVLSDIAAVCLSIAAASLVRNLLFSTPAASISRTVFTALALVLCSLMAAGLYPEISVNSVDELRLSVVSITLAYLTLWAATFFLHDLTQSRLVYLLSYVLTIILVPLLRAGARASLSKQPWWGSPVAILGFGQTGKLVLQVLEQNPRIGLRPVAILDDDPRQYADADPKLIRGALARCLEMSHHRKISYAIVCMPSLSRHDLLHLLEKYGQCFGRIMVIPNLIGMTSLGISVREMGGILGLEVTQQLLRPSAQLLKRTLDLAMTLAIAPAVIGLVALSALLIKAETGGSVFYANERIGRKGRIFKAWKLRSMVSDGDEVLRQYLQKHPDESAQWAATQKLKRDPRLTRVGRIIRKTSIDELPQFWNVLIGNMSVVGPRPMLENQIEMYGPGFELYKQVRPGITGLWQVSGRNNLTFAERAKLDKYVIQNWSVWLDLYLLARTAGAVLSGDGAY